MRKSERAHFETIQRILDEDECNCTDPPWCDGDDHPSEHSQVCPVYLAAYLQAVLDGRTKANPDSWPDAPLPCVECGRTIGRPHGCECATEQDADAAGGTDANDSIE